jgi:putative redox protein
VTVTGSAAGFAQEISVGRHRLSADEPTSEGGTDSGPNPYDLLLAALGSCTSMTVALYARRKGWPLDRVSVKLQHSKIHAADCESCETREGLLDHIDRMLELTGRLSDEQRARLLEIANKCPVHHTLTSEIDIQTRLA